MIAYGVYITTKMVNGYDLRDKGQGLIIVKICLKALNKSYFDVGRQTCSTIITLGA